MRLLGVALMAMSTLLGSAWGTVIPGRSLSFRPRTPYSRQQQTQKPRKSRTMSEQAISIRGGGAGLFPFRLVDQDLVAKAADLFFMGQASTAWLAPHRTCEKYGLSTRLLNVAANRKLATAYLGSAVIMYGMLFQKCTLNTAIGASAVVWMMEQLRSRLYYEAENVGRPLLGDYVIAAFAVLTAYATLYSAPWARLAIQVSALLQLANGLSFFAAPVTMCIFWKIPIRITASPEDKQEYKEQLKQYNETVYLHRYMGVALVFAGILQTVLAWDGSIYQAVGSAFSFLFSINLYSFLKTSDFKRLARTSIEVQKRARTRPKWSKLFFPAFNGVIASTLILGGNEPASRGARP